MITQIYSGLVVKDMNKAADFYTALGFEADPRFTGDEMRQFKLSDHINISLFLGKEMMIRMPIKGLEAENYGSVVNAIALETKAEIVALIDKAKAAGGVGFAQANDNDFMYMDGFKDLDGHLWTLYTMK